MKVNFSYSEVFRFKGKEWLLPFDADKNKKIRLYKKWIKSNNVTDIEFNEISKNKTLA